jgi:hypothetical protein
VAIDEDDLLDDEHNKSAKNQPIHMAGVGLPEAMSRQGTSGYPHPLSHHFDRTESWMKLLSPADSTSAKIARGEDILTTLIDEQNRHNLSYHIKQEVGDDEESDDGMHIAHIARAKNIASKMLNRQRSKVTEVKRPLTAPPTTGTGSRATIVNPRRNSKLK